MSKLIVAGCSVSDYTKVDKVWGEYLADKLGYSYVHEARGCGSNYRMWRVLSSKIISGIINPLDTIIVQYTTLERNEFWSPIEENIQPVYLREKYKTGSIIRFKTDSYSFNYNPTERKLLKLYERFISIEYETEKFVNNHMMIQCLAKEYNIDNLYFVKAGSYGLNSPPMIAKYEKNYFEYNDIFSERKNHLLGDTAHLSDIGHQTLADLLFKELTK